MLVENGSEKLPSATNKGTKGFTPGVSGNPKGRPKGSRNKTTLMAQALFDDKGQAIVDKVLQLALNEGHPGALKICIDRLVPPVKSRPLDLPLPPIRTPKDVVTAYSAVVAAVFSGQISIEEANGLSVLLGNASRAIKTLEVDNRVARIEGLLGLGPLVPD